VKNFLGWFCFGSVCVLGFVFGFVGVQGWVGSRFGGLSMLPKATFNVVKSDF